MKLTEIHFTPKAEVQFTSAEYELMLECSAVHYDGVCKDAGKEKLFDGRPGFLFGAHRIHINTGHQPVTFTFRELDTLAKILEVGQCLPDYMSRSLLIGQLRTTLQKALQALNESKPASIVDPLSGPSYEAVTIPFLGAFPKKRDEGGARYSDKPWNEG